MLKFQNCFKKSCAIIGMIHVDGLPGTPKYSGSTNKIIQNAIKDAEIYLESGIDAVLVENMHDIPYVRPKELTPETTTMMTRICTEIRRVLPRNIPCGIQILAGCNKEALAVAQAADFQFIRAEGFVFSHIADEGFIDGSAGTLLRYRKQIGANDILIFTDVKKKHSSHAITSDISLGQTVMAAEFFLSDGIVLTGFATGCPTDVNDLTDVKQVSNLPVLIGSGITIDNVQNYLTADALIIGSHFKVNGKWKNPIQVKNIKNFMKRLKELKS